MPIVLDGEIRSTSDLQKRTKDVLDTASDHPVVIRREEPNDDIALMSHALARKAYAAYQLAPQFLGLMRYVFARLVHADDQVPHLIGFEWLSAFDRNDILEFSTELSESLLRVISGDRPLSDIEFLLEQWRRSANVLRDEELRNRLERERSLVITG